jgi:HK97 family phage prohead protease
MLQKTLSLSDVQLKFADGNGEDAWTFSGYASKFNGVDSYGDTILPGAYSKVLKAIRSGAARMPKMFVNHRSWELPVGKWLKMGEDSDGLLVDGEFTKGMPSAVAVRAALQHETVDGLSVGIRLDPNEVEIVDKGDGSRPQRIIKSVAEVAEISIVTFPADDAARIDVGSVKSAIEGFTSLSEFEDYMRDVCGFSRSAAKAFVSGIRKANVRSESVAATELPQDLARLIADNLSFAKHVLKGI